MQQNIQNKPQIDWKNLIAEQEKSGLSQKEFFSRRGLVFSQFVYYRCSRNKSKAIQAAEQILKPVKVISKEPSVTSGDILYHCLTDFSAHFPVLSM